MKNYTNKYSQERMYIMSEEELREQRKDAVKRYKEMKKRKRKRVAKRIAIGLMKVTLVILAELAVITMFICAIPPR